MLDGAKALALPTKFGQDFVVEDSSEKKIHWKSLDADGSIWFDAEISFHTISENQQTDHVIKNTLVKILHTAFEMNPTFLESEGYAITTHLTFPRFWGLGTSSTLINNIAQWLSIDAYELLWRSFGGSGYDIACAQNDSALVYQLANQKPSITPVSFHPEFADQLYFVYLNQKQSSKSAITAYRNKKGSLGTAIASVNTITAEIMNTQNAKMFAVALDRHESLLSEILEMPTVKKNLFHDFNGTVKSLGAWGGDFALAVSESDPRDYFKSKGYPTIIPYFEMIL